MSTKLTGRGGAGRGQGRKVALVSNAMVGTSIKLTPDQREKLARLGGSPWVREKIDKAREPSGDATTHED